MFGWIKKKTSDYLLSSCLGGREAHIYLIGFLNDQPQVQSKVGLWGSFPLPVYYRGNFTKLISLTFTIYLWKSWKPPLAQNNCLSVIQSLTH